jgi:hypothetical protein
VAAGALLLVFCAPRAAAAPAPGEDLIEQGVALRRQGNDDKALPLFREAHQRAHTPRSAALLGFAEQALAQWVQAERHLSEAMASEGDPWIRTSAPLIQESLRFVQRHLGSVQVDVGVAGAEVTVDGASVGRTPLPAAVRAAVGDRWVEVRAAGYRSHLSVVAVQAGKTSRVSAHLQAEAPPRAVAPPPPAAAATASAGASLSPAAEQEPPVYRSWWLWTGVALVLAGVGVAVVAASGGSSYACGGAGRVCAQ